jgi:hypothetical protein
MYSASYHHREAARWAGYTWTSFERLSAEDQAGVIAHYEIHNELQYLESVEQAKMQRRKAKP